MKRSRPIALALAAAAAAFLFSCGPKTPGAGEGMSTGGPQMTAQGVTFALHAPKAHKVMIVGDFNSWSTTADPMYDREEKGTWTITLPLKPGRYEYKFFVDGEKWMPDVSNPKRVKDGFGAFNSVIEVKP